MDLVPYTVSAMTQMGKEMRAAADKYPCNKNPVYSNTEAEAVERSLKQVRENAPQNGHWMMEVGLSRAIDRRRDDRSIISLAITLETFCEPQQYRLSMCRITGPSTFASVPDEDAFLIARCVLGEEAQKVPNPSGIENSKHFVKKCTP